MFAPLLLTDSADALPRSVESYFLDVRPGYQDDPRTAVYNHVWLLGDTSALSEPVQSRLDEIARLIPVQVEGGQAPPAPAPGGQQGARPQGSDRRRAEPRKQRTPTPGRGPRGRDD